jgi:hypothetical protein
LANLLELSELLTAKQYDKYENGIQVREFSEDESALKRSKLGMENPKRDWITFSPG